MTVELDAPMSAIAPGDLSRLRRMKATATGFLATAAVIYGCTFIGSGGGNGLVGFVRAGSEAAMVGGLADWFAVTALFRRPFHLPIPHTAIIPNKKDEIGSKLGAFVTANFLTADLMTRHLAEANIVSKVGRRLREPMYADRLGVEVSHAISVALEEIDPDAVVRLGVELARRDLERRSYAPLLGQLLERLVEGDVQRPLVELITSRAHAYIAANRAELQPMFKEYLEDQHFLLWLAITDKRTDRLIDLALRVLDEMTRDARHPLRRSIDGMLQSLAESLQSDGVAAARLDAIAKQILDNDSYQEPLRHFVRDAVASFRTMLDDEQGALAASVSQFIQGIGQRIENDAAFEAMLEAWLLRITLHAVRDYGDELTTLIRRTVAGWDPTAASRRIEVAVGRDLQFIRINGTVVGALAGLTIHAVTVAV
ncbi:MAG: DUF445 domain-containing protein [Frankiaceae bacterium]|nr:DUF445 domain-containing protein [Frankiaceae bacterium]MBV9869634.1 DUF445 domain-containing protein [Frankiaceae bacterium]